MIARSEYEQLARSWARVFRFGDRPALALRNVNNGVFVRNRTAKLVLDQEDLTQLADLLSHFAELEHGADRAADDAE